MAERGERPGVFASLGGILKTGAAMFHNRLELLMVEVEEERWRFFHALLLAGMVLVLAGMTLMAGTIAAVVLCLNAGRGDLVLALIGFYLVATAICYWRLRSRLKDRELFPATRAELRKDKACLEEKN
jgi:uncharacterized membrane protein YqjE